PDSLTSFVCAVNRRSWLPRWYEIRRGKISGAERTTPTAHLDIAYDVPIPEDVRSLPTSPADYVKYDSTRTPPVTDAENTMTSGGITVELQPLATDAEGNVLIKARGWIGDRLIDKDSPLQIGLSISDRASNFVSYTPRLSYDDKKRAYVEVNWAPLQIGNPDDAGSLM